MIEYARIAERWQTDSNFGYYDTEQQWLHLMGLDAMTQKSWRAEHTAIVAEMAPSYKQWAERHLVYERPAAWFINFLCQEAARPLLGDGLVWLEQALT